jgi:insulysin
LYYLSYITHEKLWTPEEKCLELESVTAQDIQNYYPTILSHMHVEALAHGNCFAEEAINMMEMIEDILKPRAVLPSQLAGPRTLLLPEGTCINRCS